MEAEEELASEEARENRRERELFLNGRTISRATGRKLARVVNAIAFSSGRVTPMRSIENKFIFYIVASKFHKSVGKDNPIKSVYLK